MEFKDKILIFSPFNFSPKFIGPNFEILQKEIDKGNKVYYLSNKKTFKTCGFNPYGLKYMCEICVYRENKVSDLITGKYESLTFKDIINESDTLYAETALRNIDVITYNLVIENFAVGESVYSSFISKTREREFTDSKDQAILKRLALQSLTIYHALRRFIKVYSINKLLLFNGRWDYYRAAYAAASIENIKINVFELLRPGGFYEDYGASLPHNIKLRESQIQAHWEKENDYTKKEKIARDFYSRKRKGEAVLDKSYTTSQKVGKLPEYIDRNKKLIVLYNSSDDEFAAIGNEFSNPFFKDQMEGILYVADLISKNQNYQLIIRIHPNLTGLERDFVTPIYELDNKYLNVFIVKPDEDVDTYALMEAASKVITFGSTIGLEASYWGKPVLLLAKTYYYYTDVAYVPESKGNIVELLFDDLSPKNKLNAEKHAFYYLNGGTKAEYYSSDATGNHKFNGKSIDTFSLPFKVYYKALKLFRIKN
jgi:hypothetical protein